MALDPILEGFITGRQFAQKNAMFDAQIAQYQREQQQQQEYQNALTRMMQPQTQQVVNPQYVKPELLESIVAPWAEEDARAAAQNAFMKQAGTQWDTPGAYERLYQEQLPIQREALMKQVRQEGYDVPSRSEVVPFQPKTYAEFQAMQDYAKQMHGIYSPTLEAFSQSKNTEGIKKIAEIYQQSGNPMLMQMGQMLSTFKPLQDGYSYIQNPIKTTEEAQRFLLENQGASRIYKRAEDVPLGQYLNITVGDDGNVKKIDFEKLGSEAKQQAIPREFPATPTGIAALKSMIDPSDTDALTQLRAITPVTGMTLSAKKDPDTGKTYITIGGSAGVSASQERQMGIQERRLALAEEAAARAADPEFQARLAAARSEGVQTAKNDVAAAQALPKITAKAETSIANIDALIGRRDDRGRLLKGQSTHPGFEDAVGATWKPGARFVPGTDAADFMTRLGQIKGTSFLEAFESLKGGGSITQIEGEKATDAINRMSTAQSEKEFVQSALELRNIIQQGVERAQKRAELAGKNAAATTSAPVVIRDDVEYNKLTSGQKFVGPDGKLRVKP